MPRELFAKVRLAEISSTYEIRCRLDPERPLLVQLERAIGQAKPVSCDTHPGDGIAVNVAQTLEKRVGPEMPIHLHSGADGLTVCVGRSPDGKTANTLLVPLDQSIALAVQAWISEHAGSRVANHDGVEGLAVRYANLEAVIKPSLRQCASCAFQVCGIGEDLLDRSFSNFKPLNQELKANLETARKFAEQPRGVLLLGGRPGTGKSHLGVSIARAVYERGCESIQFTKWRDFTEAHRDYLRKSAWFREEDRTEFPCATPKPINPLITLQSAELLILDELKELRSDTEEDLMLDLMEHRIRQYLPTVITFNIPPEQFEQAMGGRLHDRLKQATFALLEFSSESMRGNLNRSYLEKSAQRGPFSRSEQ